MFGSSPFLLQTSDSLVMQFLRFFGPSGTEFLGSLWAVEGDKGILLMEMPSISEDLE